VRRPTGYDAPAPPPAVRRPKRGPAAAPPSTSGPDPHPTRPVSDRRIAREDRVRLRRARRARKRAEAAEVRRFTRSARRRRLVALSAAAFLLVSVATPVLLAVSPAFAVRTITVTGASGSVADAVRARLEPQLGVPIALIDTKAVAREVAAVAQVQSFSTVRLPPDRLEVRVVERTPVAQVKAADGYHLVDAAQVTLSVRSSRLTGYPVVRLPSGSTAESAFAAAAAVLRVLPADLAARVGTVSATSRDDVTLTLNGGRRVVWGSADDSSRKAAALRAALVSAARGAHVLDVSAPGIVSTR
jgi:cell division protein FtsQ